MLWVQVKICCGIKITNENQVLMLLRQCSDLQQQHTCLITDAINSEAIPYGVISVKENISQRQQVCLGYLRKKGAHSAEKGCLEKRKYKSMKVMEP